MDTIIASNESAISSRLVTCLRQVGVECRSSQVMSHESAQALLAAGGSRGQFVVFFGSQQFLPDELALLKQMCAGGGDRIKVIAVGPANSPATILQAVHSGATDYLDINNHLEGELHNLFDRLRSTHSDGAKAGRLFAIIGAVGGTGASLLAVNLAAALAQKEQLCGLLDFQLRGGDLATLLKCNARHTVVSLAEKANHLDRAMFDQSLIKHECGIHLLAGPEPFSELRPISPQVTKKIVQLARMSYPNVVVDLEDAEHAEQVRTLAASDRIIIPLRLDFVSLYRTKKCIEFLLRANVVKEHITLVATRTGQPKELQMSRVVEVLGFPVDHQIPNDPAVVNTSVNLGVPLVVSSPDSGVGASIIRLADSLIGMKHAVKEPARSVAGLFSVKSMESLLGMLPFNRTAVPCCNEKT